MRETGGLELVSTITLVLQENRLIRYHKLCFQSMLRSNHGWFHIKLKKIRRKELSDAVSKSTKNVKINYFTGRFHKQAGFKITVLWISNRKSFSYFRKSVSFKWFKKWPVQFSQKNLKANVLTLKHILRLPFTKTSIMTFSLCSIHLVCHGTLYLWLFFITKTFFFIHTFFLCLINVHIRLKVHVL